MNDEPRGAEHVDVTRSAGWLAAGRAGDAQAARAFDDAWRPRLERFCAGYVGAQDGEDAAQEVLVKLWTLDERPSELRAFLYRVARNHCLNRLRAAGRRPSGPDAAELSLAASLTGPVTRLARAEEREQLLALIERLDEGERELLRLRYAEDLSRGEIAEVLRLRESVVKSRLFEAMRKLRKVAGL